MNEHLHISIKLGATYLLYGGFTFKKQLNQYEFAKKFILVFLCSVTREL
jgi:hypothetical protein